MKLLEMKMTMYGMKNIQNRLITEKIMQKNGLVNQKTQ